MPRARPVSWFLVSFMFFLQVPASATPCTFETAESVVERNQRLLYAGYLNRAVEAWTETADPSACPLLRAYRANALFWRLMVHKVNDELTPEEVQQFLDYTTVMKHEATQRDPTDVTNAADAFAYAWIHMMRAQWHGFQKKWLSLPGDLKAGVRWLKRAGELAPERPEIQYYEGMVHYILDRRGLLFKFVRWIFAVPTGDREKAWPLLNAAVQKPSGLQTEMDMVRAAFYQQEGEWVKAQAVIQSIRRRHPNNPLFHLWEGLFYERVAGDYEAAYRVYRTIFDRCAAHEDPRYNRWVEAQALHRMGHAAYKMYRFNRALQHFQALLEGGYRAPPWVLPKTLLVMGDLYRDWGQIQQARRAYARVMQYPPVLDYRRRAAHGMHRKYDTKTWRDYQNYVIGRVAIAEGRLVQGCDHFAHALKRKRTPLIRLGWAECLAARGDMEASRQQLQKILRLKKGINLARARASAAIQLARFLQYERQTGPALRFYLLARSVDKAPGELIRFARYQIQKLTRHGG